jgi:hypothetical protein
MQDNKLVNIGGATSKKSGVYSVEFHEDSHYAHIKRANTDGTATYFPFNSPTPTAAHRFENYSDSGLTTYTAPLNTDTTVIFDGAGSFEDKRLSPEWLSHDLYDTTTGTITLTDVPIGTLVHVTFDLQLIPSSSNEQADIFFKFDAFGGYKIYAFDSDMNGQTTIHHYTASTTFFVINEDVQTNGVKLQVNTSCETEIIPRFINIALL